MKDTQKDKATPRPWSVKYEDVGDEEVCFVPCEIIGANKFNVVSCEGGLAPNCEWTKELLEANASLIVRSVNNHDTLLEACKVVMQEMLAYRRGQEPISCDAMDLLTKAIEKAEGK